MSHILTLQSHVVYGHAGNSAAVFPMQRLGHKVSALNLLQFSNHTGYGLWSGKILSAKDLSDILQGLDNIGRLKDIDAIITGYMGSIEQAEVIYEFIAQIKQERSNLIYCCDPVMGDEGRGIYVKQEIADYIQEKLIYLADWITPNHFELSHLSGRIIHNRHEAIEACLLLLERHPLLKGVLATSVADDKNHTGLLLVLRNATFYCETPKYELIQTVHGTGDLTTAVFISHILNKQEFHMAIEKTANTLHEITHYTYTHHLSELAIIEKQEAIVSPLALFSCVL